jgi:hypothetical protein
MFCVTHEFRTGMLNKDVNINFKFMDEEYSSVDAWVFEVTGFRLWELNSLNEVVSGVNDPDVVRRFNQELAPVDCEIEVGKNSIRLGRDDFMLIGEPEPNQLVVNDHVNIRWCLAYDERIER